MNTTSLDQPVIEFAEKSPERVFLNDLRIEGHERSYTYGDANRAIAEAAGALSCLPDTHIGIELSTSFRCICLVYGTIRAGKNPVLIDPEWGEAAKDSIAREMSLRSIISDSTPIVSNGALARRFEKESDGSKSKLVIFTSGTSSKPKGIVLSQKAMLHAYEIGHRCLGISEHTNAGCFYRISGLGILGIHFLFPVTYGGSATILPPLSYASPVEFFSLVRESCINFIYLVPPIVNYLVKEGRPLSRGFPSEELLCVAGSARLDPIAQDSFQRMYGPLANIYGQSECGFAFLFGQRSGEEFTNSVGPAVGLELRLLDSEGGLVTTPRTKGRLHVRTPSLFDGYVNDPEATSRVVHDGWLDTKDLACFDENGCYTIFGRTDDTIKKGGNLFHLAECEEYLNQLNGVIESCCLKVPCEAYGEDYVAIVRSRHSQTESQLKALLEAALGAVRAPKMIRLVAFELPRNGAGKYDREKLKLLIS